MRNVYKWFRKDCINEFSATEFDERGNYKPMSYRRDDLSRWAEEAFNNGEDYFYASPVDPNEPNGKLELCEPEHIYRLRHSLTQEELNELFGEEVYVDPLEFFKRRNNET